MRLASLQLSRFRLAALSEVALAQKNHRAVTSRNRPGEASSGLRFGRNCFLQVSETRRTPSARPARGPRGTASVKRDGIPAH